MPELSKQTSQVLSPFYNRKFTKVGEVSYYLLVIKTKYCIYSLVGQAARLKTPFLVRVQLIIMCDPCKDKHC